MDKDLLFKPRLPEADVDIPGVGTVRVRGLSRAEVMLAEDIKGTAAKERRMLSLGMVDPALTEAEAGRWQKASAAGELEPVTNRIAQLSGLLPDSGKAAYKSDGGEPGPGVRVLPGPEVGPDGGGTAGEPA